MGEGGAGNFHLIHGFLLPSPDPWEGCEKTRARGTPDISTLPAPLPQRRNPALSGPWPLCSPTLSLIHPSFPSSSPARPFPLASLQHNGLAALGFHDTLAVCRPQCFLSLSHTSPHHFHSLDVPVPPVSHSLDGHQSQGSHIQKCSFQSEVRPLGGRP